MADLIEPFAGSRAEAVAGRIIKRFGSLQSALVSPADETDTDEDSDVLCQIRAARKLVLEAAREEIVRQSVSSDSASLRDYLKGLLGSQEHEVLHAVFLDRSHGYITDEQLAAGSRHGIAGSMRSLIARALELRACGVILAHNHPSGCPLPSQSDLDTTARIAELAAELEILLCDHLIVTQRAVFSFRRAGLL